MTAPQFPTVPLDRRRARRLDAPGQLLLFTTSGSARPHLHLLSGGLVSRPEGDVPVAARRAA